MHFKTFFPNFNYKYHLCKFSYYINITNIILQKNFLKFYFIQRRYLKKKRTLNYQPRRTDKQMVKSAFFKFTNVSYVERTKQKSKAKHDLRYGPRITSQFPSFDLPYLPASR